MSFEEPIMFALVLLVPPLLYLRYFWQKRGGRLVFSFMNWSGDGVRNTFSLQFLIYAISHVLSWLALVLLIFALAGPYTISKKKVYTTRGIDIMLVMDISPSMAAQDIADKSRLESAQNTISRFIDQRRNDPIGLIAFGSQAVLRVPPTLNYSYLRQSLESLRILTLGEGTAVGMGIALATLHLQNSTASERIIILITDGETNSDEIRPETAAELAKRAGIRIYIIDMGSDQEVLIEYSDPETGQTYRALYQGAVQEELLRSLSEQTRGQYYAVRNLQTLENVLRNIDNLERIESRLRIEIERSSLIPQFIWASFVLIFLDFCIRKLMFREIL